MAYCSKQNVLISPGYGFCVRGDLEKIPVDDEGIVTRVDITDVHIIDGFGCRYDGPHPAECFCCSCEVSKFFDRRVQDWGPF